MMSMGTRSRLTQQSILANPNEAAIGFDVSYGALGTSMAFAKDAVESKSTLPVQNSISSYLGNATDIWLHALEDSASSVFNEPESLFQLVDRGMLFGNGQADESATDVLDAMKTALYASLVRALWTSGSDRKRDCYRLFDTE